MTPAIPPDARALTIRQPWASLIALGVKTIGTRSWSTRYRGPLVIHAGKARPPCSQWEDGPFDDLDRFQYGAFTRGPLDTTVDDASWWLHDAEADAVPVPMPLGAVVAVVDLVDVVPIIDGSLGWTEDSDTPPAAVVVSWRGSALLVDTREIGPFPDLTDQLPYGDFTPGRYAWLLDNPRAIDPPIPAKGKLGPWRPDAALRLEVSKAAHLAEVTR